MGGTNAHAILDDASHYLQSHGLRGRHSTQLRPRRGPCQDQYTGCNGNVDLPNDGCHASSMKLLLWSAADANALNRMKGDYSEYFAKLNLSKDNESPYLDSLAYTLGVRRTHFPFRAFAVAGSSACLHNNLSIQGTTERCIERPKLCFVFTGQGAQWYAMGRELRAYPVFERSLFDADRYLQSLGCPWSVVGTC